MGRICVLRILAWVMTFAGMVFDLHHRQNLYSWWLWFISNTCLPTPRSANLIIVYGCVYIAKAAQIQRQRRVLKRKWQLLRYASLYQITQCVLGRYKYRSSTWTELHKEQAHCTSCKKNYEAMCTAFICHLQNILIPTYCPQKKHQIGVVSTYQSMFRVCMDFDHKAWW